ncbi:LysM peptidoglycan-binding domain-containing protein [Bradyrhizobium diazoefficiens]|nr:LysM peptidoglycan-binding domain-containing protein [Bradyrhizobium diazoefficiens]MBR0850907.1 LysM peptidoglycan-binding domain-containing protein [Bradyrhizobium diazoefficiens]
MITASKALIAFCLLAVGGTALVIGPTELRRLLPGGTSTGVAFIAKPEVNAEATKPAEVKVAEAKPDSRPETKVEPQTNNQAKTQSEAKPETKADVAAAPKPDESKLAAAQPAAPAPAQAAPAPKQAGALAETQKQVTAALADLAPVKVPPTATEAGPRFDVARVDDHGEAAVIAGVAAPGAKVELLRDGQPLHTVTADAAGQFVMTPPQLPAGSYELTLRAKAPDGTVTQSSRTMPVTIAASVLPPVRVAPPTARPEAKSVERPDAAPDVVAALPAPRLAAAPVRPRPPAKPRLAAHPTLASASPADIFNAAPVEPGGSRVIVRGDSLWALSRLAYGDGAHYAAIVNANRDKIHNPNLIYPGQTFMLPLKAQ